MHANRESAPIDRLGNSDQDFPFGIWKSGNGMSVDFGQNADNKIGMNPSRTIKSTHREPSEAHIHMLPGPGRGSDTY